MNNNLLNNAIIYVGGADRRELKKQENKCREYATQQKLNVALTFKEEPNCLKFSKRKALRRMRAYCFYTQNIKYIIVYQEANVARNNSELFLVKRFLQGCNTELVFVMPAAGF